MVMPTFLVVVLIKDRLINTDYYKSEVIRKILLNIDL